MRPSLLATTLLAGSRSSGSLAAHTAPAPAFERKPDDTLYVSPENRMRFR